MQKFISQLLNDSTGFNIKPVVTHERNCLLITPEDITVKWNDDNKYFRSMLVDADTYKVWSMGFRKFTNFGESPAFEPWDNKWSFEATRKMDGSLLCISKMNGNIVARTRGVADATVHETGEEIEIFKTKYPFLFNNEYINNEKFTILCEHTTPNRIIVLREHDEPTLTLLAIVDNESGEYLESVVVDENAKAWNISRPKYYYYSSISECIADVNMWRDSEGVVIRHGQILKKVKAEHYLTLHKLKSSIASLGNLLDVYLTSTNRGDYNSFYNFIETTMDYELAEACKDNMRKITNTNVEILAETEEAKQFVSTLNGATRKDNAVAICQKYNDWRKGLCFNLLDGKPNIREKANLAEVFMNKMK
jgi:hypothetical protein